MDEETDFLGSYDVWVSFLVFLNMALMLRKII